MVDTRIENINVFSEDPLITPEELKQQFPLTEKAVATVMRGQRTILNILNRKDHRLFVVVGPCSIHDIDAARAYAVKLTQLAEEVSDTLFLVMRVYFEKPRTTVGWQGLIIDPHLDRSHSIEDGLQLARGLLLEIAEMGLPAAGEALDIVSPQYIQDLFSWTAIGARTTESQTHRKMASALSSAVGFKNGTNGNLAIAINAMQSAAHANHFISVNPAGRVAVIRTKGNPYTHVVLRGGIDKPNYDPQSIAACEQKLAQADLAPRIMVDCSHANSQQDPARQLDVIESIIQQIRDGNHSIIGLMIESNLRCGKQSIPHNLQELQYGVSITDACIDWETTERAVRRLRAQLIDVLASRHAIFPS